MSIRINTPRAALCASRFLPSHSISTLPCFPLSSVFAFWLSFACRLQPVYCMEIPTSHLTRTIRDRPASTPYSPLHRLPISLLSRHILRIPYSLARNLNHVRSPHSLPQFPTASASPPFPAPKSYRIPTCRTHQIRTITRTYIYMLAAHMPTSRALYLVFAVITIISRCHPHPGSQ
ncbi:hypothetical protein B0H21DRAFT_22993 [Amylocystis lapponica]|nr:hypothetical protein B0H21DRAFT_22993 [Amylocystis lapponica]